MAQTGSALDRPAAFGPAPCPLQQSIDLPDRSTDAELPQFRFTRVQRERRVRSLVRIDTDHHARHPDLLRRRDVKVAAGMSDFRSTGFAPFEPHRNEIRRTGTSING